MEILQLRRNGLSVSAIARRTGHDRKTVRGVLARDGEPLSRKRRGGVERHHKLKPFEGYVHERMGQGVYNAVVLFAELRQRGYTGGMTVLREYVQPFRPKVPFATLRFETEPGEQAQVDFVDIRFDLPDGRSELVHVLLYVLAYSRVLVAIFLPAQSRVHFLRGLDHAFRVTGGVPRHVLSDNLKAAVIGRNEHGEPIFAPEYLAFAKHYGFTPMSCRPRRAQTKGKVERPARYLRENFLPRIATECTELDLGQLNRRLQHWLDNVANVRVHGTTHERPVDRLTRVEAAALQAVPIFSYGLDEISVRRVSRDGFVEWKTCRYAVPWQLASRDVMVRETSDGWLRVEFDGVEKANYAVSSIRDQVFERAEFREGLAEATLSRVGVRLQNAPLVDQRPLSEYDAIAQGAVR